MSEEKKIKLSRKKIGAILIILSLGTSLILMESSGYLDYIKLKEIPGKTMLISDNERPYNAFPKAIKINHTNEQYNNSILVVWYSGNGHIDSNNDGIIKGAVSHDEGNSWENPYVIYNDPNYDCRNIGIICSPNGTIIIFFAKVDVDIIYEDKYSAWIDFGFIKSYDGGNTWSNFQSVISSNNIDQFTDYKALGIATGNGYGDAFLLNGTIYLMCYGFPDQSNPEISETHLSYFMRSLDNGENWEFISNLALGTGLHSSEADFWYENNTFFGFTRTQTDDPRYLYYFESQDMGESWNLTKTNIQGDCPDIFRLSDGRYIVAFRIINIKNYYTAYFTLPADFINRPDKLDIIQSLNMDNLENNNDDVQSLEISCLIKNSFNINHGDLGYPSIISISEEKILLAYYDIDAGGVFVKVIEERLL